jgi:hypothetical protein
VSQWPRFLEIAIFFGGNYYAERWGFKGKSVNEAGPQPKEAAAREKG